MIYNTGQKEEEKDGEAKRRASFWTFDENIMLKQYFKRIRGKAHGDHAA